MYMALHTKTCRIINWNVLINHCHSHGHVRYHVNPAATMSIATTVAMHPRNYTNILRRTAAVTFHWRCHHWSRDFGNDCCDASTCGRGLTQKNSVDISSLSYGRQVQQLLATCTSGSSLHHRVHRCCRCALMYTVNHKKRGTLFWIWRFMLTEGFTR